MTYPTSCYTLAIDPSICPGKEKHHIRLWWSINLWTSFWDSITRDHEHLKSKEEQKQASVNEAQYWYIDIPYVPHCQCRIHNHEHGQLAKGLLRIEQRYILSFRDELWVLLPKLGRDSRWPSMEYLKDRGHTLLFLLFWYHILVLNFSQWNIEILLWRAVS